MKREKVEGGRERESECVCERERERERENGGRERERERGREEERKRKREGEREGMRGCCDLPWENMQEPCARTHAQSLSHTTRSLLPYDRSLLPYNRSLLPARTRTHSPTRLARSRLRAQAYVNAGVRYRFSFFLFFSHAYVNAGVHYRFFFFFLVLTHM